jgi:hypothetical protein
MTVRPVYDNITAHAGGTQALGYPLLEGINRVTVVATAADSVTLPSTQDIAGTEVIVINADSTDSMNVFPAVGEAINALTANTTFALVAGKTAMFLCTGPGRWHAILTA